VGAWGVLLVDIPMIEDKIRQKIETLITRSVPIVTSSHGRAGSDQHLAQCHGWIAEALNVIQLAIQSPKNAYRVQIEKAASSTVVAVLRAASMAEILRSLLPDIAAGLLGNLENKVRAETFDDFLDHAEFYLRDSRKMEAGVIAGVVFEDTIRRMFRDKISDDKGQKVEDIINALAKQGVITGQQSKQAKVAAHVRTKATHAQWDEFDLAGVEAAIQITKLFLREHFGG
jgi:hypothetical protein